MILPYAAVRSSNDPSTYLLDFLRSSYAIAAHLGGWNRAWLERDQGALGRPPAGS